MVAFLPYGDSHIFTDCLSSYFLNDLLSFFTYNVLTKSLYTRNFPYDNFKVGVFCFFLIIYRFLNDVITVSFDHFKISYCHFFIKNVECVSPHFLCWLEQKLKKIHKLKDEQHLHVDMCLQYISITIVKKSDLAF